jgi:hypothetical protein
MLNTWISDAVTMSGAVIAIPAANIAVSERINILTPKLRDGTDRALNRIGA